MNDHKFAKLFHSLFELLVVVGMLFLGACGHQSSHSIFAGLTQKQRMQFLDLNVNDDDGGAVVFNPVLKKWLPLLDKSLQLGLIGTRSAKIDAIGAKPHEVALSPLLLQQQGPNSKTDPTQLQTWFIKEVVLIEDLNAVDLLGISSSNHTSSLDEFQAYLNQQENKVLGFFRAEDDLTGKAKTILIQKYAKEPWIFLSTGDNELDDGDIVSSVNR